MTNAQKLTVRASEIRQRLNEISGLEGDALTDEVRAESTTLGNEFADVETKLRAAITADDGERTVATEDGEARELRQLTEKTNLGSILAAAVERRFYRGGRVGASTASRARTESDPARPVEASAGRESGHSRTDERRNRAGHNRSACLCEFGGRVLGRLSTDRPGW